MTIITAPMIDAAEYVIDTKGAHASIEFKTGHLGYSYLTGRFNTFEGGFSYDPQKPEASTVTVNIDTQSVDSNHEKRDQHLRSADFLDVQKYPKASFVSSSVKVNSDGSMDIAGDLTLHGITKQIVIKTKKIGEGKDPWGGYRAGFTGNAQIMMKDFGIAYNLGPAATTIDLTLNVEGIRQ